MREVDNETQRKSQHKQLQISCGITRTIERHEPPRKTKAKCQRSEQTKRQAKILAHKDFDTTDGLGKQIGQCLTFALTSQTLRADGQCHHGHNQ